MGPYVCLSRVLRPALNKAGLALIGMLFMSAAQVSMARAGQAPDRNPEPHNPARAEATPAPTKAVPAPAKATPAPAEAVPARAKATPAPTKAVPAPAKATPAPTKAVPARAKATPAPTKATPAPAKATPAPTKAASTSDGENEKTRVFEYGMNMGLYLANGHTANFYNGSGGGTAGRRSLEQVLDNSQTYNRIRQDLGFDFSLDGLPGNMGYSPSILFGFFASLQLGERSALIAEFNYTRLTAEDQFTLRLERFSNIEGDNIERFTISGSEERIDLRLGAQYTFLSNESYLHPYLEAGISVTDTKVRNHSARIGGSSYSLFFAPTSRNVYEREYGMSPGAYAGLGLKMDVTDNFRLTLGYSSLYVRINLGENDRFLLQHTLFVRLNLNNVIGATGPVAEITSL